MTPIYTCDSNVVYCIYAAVTLHMCCSATTSTDAVACTCFAMASVPSPLIMKEMSSSFRIYSQLQRQFPSLSKQTNASKRYCKSWISTNLYPLVFHLIQAVAEEGFRPHLGALTHSGVPLQPLDTLACSGAQKRGGFGITNVRANVLKVVRSGQWNELSTLNKLYLSLQMTSRLANMTCEKRRQTGDQHRLIELRLTP